MKKNKRINKPGNLRISQCLTILWIIGMGYLLISGSITTVRRNKSLRNWPTVSVTACIKGKSHTSSYHLDHVLDCEFFINGKRYFKGYNVNKNFWKDAHLGDCVEIIISKNDPTVSTLNEEKGTFKCHQMPYSHEYVEGE
ncbi:MAG: hypothetical protein IJL56_04025 [Bacteroidales bacterium]|nr:hypothetical protein [Bacteroidales bacterium]